jgi:carbon storage regulator CsrA
MLVLTRKPGEVVMVGDAAIIVLSMGRSEVKLGFKFPNETRIVRAELTEPNAAMEHCITRYRLQEDDEGEKRAQWHARHEGA